MTDILDELELIRTRHDAWNIASECNDATKQCHTDRATLISLLDASRAELDAVREAAIDSLASLVAAHSLLKSGGKKAAASDQIFEIMLSDYARTIERTRATLGEKL